MVGLKLKALAAKLTGWLLSPVRLVTITSSTGSYTAGTAKSTDISVADQTGYEFLTWINPAGVGVTGSFYMTLLYQNQCRIWAVPTNTTSSGAVKATAVFIKST